MPKKCKTATPRIGLVAEVVSTIQGSQQINGSISLVAETVFSETGNVTAAGGISLVSELIGNTIPPAGLPFNSEIITYGHTEGPVELLVFEIRGTYPQNENVLALSWQAIGNEAPDDFCCDNESLDKVFTYDVDGCLTKVRFSDGSERIFTYDGNNNIQTITHRGVVKTITFDIDGNIDTITVT